MCQDRATGERITLDEVPATSILDFLSGPHQQLRYQMIQVIFRQTMLLWRQLTNSMDAK